MIDVSPGTRVGHAINVVNVSKSFNTPAGASLVVFDRLSLSVTSNEILAVLGPTGCGKSTLLAMIAGLICPDYGQIRFGNALNPDIGIVLQKDLLLPWRDVRGNVTLGLELKGIQCDSTAIDSALKEFGLANYAQLYPAALSGGMRQKVSLVRAILFDPHILLLDEPFANIDCHQKIELERYLLAWMRDMKRTAIFITHDIEEAVAVADRIVVLSQKPAAIVANIEVGIGSDPIATRRHPDFSMYVQKVWEAMQPNEV